MKKKLIIGLGIILTAFLVWRFAIRSKNGADQQFTFVEVTRGNVENTISSTGTLRAVGTVEVGTQVSGIIDQLLVDFNDQVKKGQMLAILDTIKLAVSVREAEVGLQKTDAQYEQAVYEFERIGNLYAQKLVSEQEYIQSRTNKKTNQVSVQIAKIALERAVSNLDYAFIRSPIDGKVIYRSVEAGQTVAASFSTPTMFVIAEDLTQMEIWAQVDESDIGTIKEGQNVRFTVQSYPDRTFSGAVRQIRLQPETVSNVVNYTVVIDAQNDDKLLLPGMTATVDFVVESKQDVLLVPNLALKVQPTEEMIAAYQENRRKQFESLPDSVKEKIRSRMGDRPDGGGQGFGRSGAMPRDARRLWLIDEHNNLQMIPIQTGISDGKQTEIVRGRDITEGMRVISGFSRSDKSQAANGTSIGQPGFGRPPRPF